MSPAWIRSRKHPPSQKYPRGHTTHQVLYRRGGRAFNIETAGTFATKTHAQTRRDLVAGWLAQGLDPNVELARLRAPAEPVRTYAQLADAYKTSRLDIDESTRTNIDTHLKRLLPIFGTRDPHALTVTENIEAVAELAADLKPSSLYRYWSTHRLILDFAGVDPNPARDRKVKLPSITGEEPQPPTARHVLAILDRVSERWRLPLVTIEQTAMTIGETAKLAWGDVDVDGCQFRLRRATVKARIRSRARWVQVPEWLLELIVETCPFEDRTAERRVFPGVTANKVGKAMSRACALAGIPVYSPHDLRHRRLSLWHGQGVPAKELAARAGHTRASTTLDVYSHVMPLEEVDKEALMTLLVRTR